MTWWLRGEGPAGSKPTAAAGIEGVDVARIGVQDGLLRGDHGTVRLFLIEDAIKCGKPEQVGIVPADIRGDMRGRHGLAQTCQLIHGTSHFPLLP